MAIPRKYVVIKDDGKALTREDGTLVRFSQASAEAYCRDRKGYKVDSYASWNGESNV